MSMIDTYSKYQTNSALLTSYGNEVSSRYKSSSSSSVSDSLLNMYSNIAGASSSNNSNSSETSKSAGSYVVDIKEQSGDILSTLNSLTAKGSKSLFNQVNGVSDSKAVSVEYSGNEKAESFTVDVSQLASTQRNEGSSLRSEAAVMDGSSLSITGSDGTVKSFYASGGIFATNESVQNELAEKINKSGMGIKATVEKDEKKGTSRLVLESNKTGIENGFSVSGDLAQTLGINTATQDAKDAVFKINGEEMTASTNKVKLNNTTNINLNSTTTESANITFERNDLKSINATRELVNNFNALMDTAKDFNDSGADKLISQLKGVAKTYKSGLSSIGISMNSKGYLEIDEDKMKEAAESGELSKFFGADNSGNENYGFNYRLKTIAQNVNNNPTQYLSKDGKEELKNQQNQKKTSGASSINANNNKRVSSYYISSYYNLSATGMLFNAMF